MSWTSESAATQAAWRQAIAEPGFVAHDLAARVGTGIAGIDLSVAVDDVLMSDTGCSLHRATEWDEARVQRRPHRIILVDDVKPIAGAALRPAPAVLTEETVP